MLSLFPILSTILIHNKYIHDSFRHFSVTGRFEKLKEVAFEYAFLLKTDTLAADPLGE